MSAVFHPIKNLCIAALLVFLYNTAFSQKKLQITAERLGNVKIYELGLNDLLEYKLKGDFFYRKKEIIDMKDTLIFFKDDDVIAFSDLKGIRIRKQQHLYRTFKGVFLIGGLGLPAISAINRLSFHAHPVLTPSVLYVSGGMLLSSFIIYELGLRHLHMNRRKTLRVIDIDFNNLNVKDTLNVKDVNRN